MKVPNYKRQVGPRTPGVEAPRVTPAQPSGSDVAAARANMGRAVQGVANQFAGFAEGLAKDAADQRIMERDTAITLETQDLLKNGDLDEKSGLPKGLLLRDGDGAAGTVEEFDKRWEALAKKHINEASGPYERAQIAARLKTTRLAARENAISHQVTQGRKAYTERVGANINALATKAAMSEDPKLLLQNAKDAAAALHPWLVSNGYLANTPAYQEKLSKGVSAVVTSGLASSINRDSKKAQELLTAAAPLLSDGDLKDLQKVVNDASVKNAEKEVWASLQAKTRLDGTIDTTPIYGMAEKLMTPDGQPATAEQKQSFIKSLESLSSGMDTHRAEVKKANDYDFLSAVYAEYQSQAKDKQKAIATAKKVSRDHADLGNKLDIIDRIWGGDTGDLRMKDKMAEFELADALERIDTLYPKGTMQVIEGQGPELQDVNGFMRTNMRRNAFGLDSQAIKEKADKLLDGRKPVANIFQNKFTNTVSLGLISPYGLEGDAALKGDLEQRALARKTQEVARKDAELKKEFTQSQIDWAAKKLGGMSVTPDNIRAVLLSVKRGEQGNDATALLARLGEQK